ncbi:MAG: lamin tail domain-containing protein [Anaerolineae bacterium]|nr:lamin tail domain-containing protein [Anaerolineae bacterium]
MRLQRIVLALIGSGILMFITTLGAQPPAHATAPLMPSALPGDVIINEVAWSGTAAAYADEWIELYNNTAVSIALTGWRITTVDGMDLALYGEIAPYGFYLIERTDDNTISDIPADRIGAFGGGGLSDAGEAITLRDAESTVIDTANVTGGAWPAGTNNPDFSMERIDNTAPDTPDNWSTNTGDPRNGLDANGAPINGTPKRRNSVSAADLVVHKSGPAHAQQGMLLTYTLRCENFGYITALSTTLTDTLPLDVVYVTSTAPNPAIVNARTLHWDLGDLPISGAPTIITVSVYAPTNTVGTITNTLVAASAVREVVPATNLAQWETLISAPAPALALIKTGPSIALPDTALTYTLVVSNTGGLTAQDIRLTDTLSTGLVFVAQTSPYPFTQSDAATLAWDIGDLTPGASGQVTLTLSLDEPLSPTLTNVATATTSTGESASAAWSAQVQPRVWLYAAQPGNYGSVSGEAVAIVNRGTFTVDLSRWCINDRVSSTNRVCFPEGAQIATGQTLWVAENTDGFYLIWGFDADWTSATVARQVPLLTGNWPGFTDDGEAVYLLDASGVPADVLAYGKGIPETGWQGPAVPHPYAGYENRGQVLYRKLDAGTGLPVPDTDSARDWAQDPDDPFNGRKLRYPGWDLEALFFPVEVDQTSTITLAVAPDGMLDFVLDAVTIAQKSLIIQGYTINSIPLYEAIDARIQASVAVTILLDSSPASGMTYEERWIAQRLHNPPTSTVYFMGGSTARYRYQHAKFIVIDDRQAIISTDNFGENSMASDPLSNGTMGHRGFVLLTDNAEVIARLNTLFHYDCDLAQHNDVFPYTEAYAPPEYFTPLPPVDWTTYTVAFSPTLVTAASHLTLLHAPEHTLREQDALIGLLNSTLTGNIDVMQLDEPITWTRDTGTVWLDAPGRNPRLAALVAAARRGVTVRVLLDAYYDDPLDNNGNTATCLYLKSLNLPTLQCRLGNITGLGIHAKVFLVDTGDAQWVHLGSINGTETSNKINREVALQFESPAGYAYIEEVFDHDWALSHGPMVHRVYLPLLMRDYVPPVDYPLISEVFINPGGEDTGKEWIEIYHPGYDTVDLGRWSIGDALDINNYGDGRYFFPIGTQLLPKQVIVVAACATEFAARYGFNPTYEWTDCDPLTPDLTPVPPWDGFGIALGNVTDEVLLLDAAAVIVDSAAWGGEPRAGVVPFPMDPESTFPWDASLKRYPPDHDRNDCSRDFYISYQPSPGQVSGAE